MFVINKSDLSIYLTRGDIAIIEVSANESETEANGSEPKAYEFKSGDIVRLKITEKNHCDRVVLEKDINVESPTFYVTISLSSKETRIGDLINKPKDYWYEIELNPDTNPQTIIGYDVNGPKIFRLFPEGDDVDGDSN